MHFPLAPMSPLIFWMTAALLGLPVLFAALALRADIPSLLLWVALFLLLLYAAVWLWWRPSAFEVSPGRLTILFPARRRELSIADLASCRQVTGRTFRNEYGWAVRIGVGGLWGGFGRLWTSRRGWVEFYISRTDGLVLVEPHGGVPLLVTPLDANGFVELVEGGG